MLSLSFRFILTATLWGTLTGFLIWGVKCLFCRKLSAGAMFLMWSIFLLKLAVPVGPQSAFSLFNVLRANPLNQSGIGVSLEQITAPAQTAAAEPASAFSFWTVAAAVWLIVAVCLGLWFFLSSLVLKYRLSQSSVCTEARMLRLLDDAKRKLGVRREFRLLIQPCIATPSLYGVFRPKILLPLNMDGFSDDEMSYVFLHELSHYKRRDMIINCLLTLLQLLHWFNPFIWFFFRKIREDMELATDEAAMKKMEETDYLAYGRTLLMAVERFSLCRISGSMMSMAHTKSNLKRRLKRICHFKRPPLAWSLFAVVMTLVLGLTCLTDAKQVPLLSIPQAGTSAASAELSEFLSRQPERQAAVSSTPSPSASPAVPTPTPDGGKRTGAADEPGMDAVPYEPIPEVPIAQPPAAPEQTPEPPAPPELTELTEPNPEEPLPSDEPVQAPPITPAASRSLLTPGTDFSDMTDQALESGTMQGSYPFPEGASTLSSKADSSGCLRLYLSSEALAAVDIFIIDPETGTELAQLTIIPRTYYAYLVSGLTPGSEYLLRLDTETAGQLLIY